MTMPKGFGDKDPKAPAKRRGSGNGKKIGVGVAAAVVVLVVIGVIGASQSSNNASLNAATLADTSQDLGSNETSLRAIIAIDKDPIRRGDVQTVRIAVTDEDGTITLASVMVEVFYAGEATRTFSGETDEDGYFTFSWQIGGNSNPGLFRVNAIVTYFSDTIGTSASFTVTEA
jgi:hypothetical protein